MSTEVDNYILVGKMSDLVMVKHYKELEEKNVRIQASLNMSRFPIGNLLPANFDIPVVNTKEGHENIDRFINYSMVVSVLAHTPSLLLIVDAFSTVIGHRILDVIYTTISNIMPRRIKDHKEMGIHTNSTGMQEWYGILKNCERLQYSFTEFNHKSDLNNIDNKINGIINSQIEDVIKMYFSSKLSPSMLGSVKAMPTKILAFSSIDAIDKEFPYNKETREFGYRNVDAKVAQMQKNLESFEDGSQEKTNSPPEGKIEISSH